MANRATRESWRNKPMGDDRLRLPLEFALDKRQMDAVSMGVIPRDMDDRWFIFYENDRLHCHRSWTGLAVYEIRFEFDGRRHVAREVWAFHNRQAQVGSEQEQILHHLDFLPRLLEWHFGVTVRSLGATDH